MRVVILHLWIYNFVHVSNVLIKNYFYYHFFIVRTESSFYHFLYDKYVCFNKIDRHESYVVLIMLIVHNHWVLRILVFHISVHT